VLGCVSQRRHWTESAAFPRRRDGFTEFTIGRAFVRPVGLTHPDYGLICPTGQANQFDFAGHRDARSAQNARNRMRLKAKFSCPINAISGFQKKVLTATPNQWLAASRPASTRGAYASSRNAGRDAMDAEVPLTSGAEADGEIVWS